MSNFVSIPPDFFHNFSLIYNDFIIFHEYSNEFVIISADKVRVLCRSINLVL